VNQGVFELEMELKKWRKSTDGKYGAENEN
jgi:hypothetical protein